MNDAVLELARLIKFGRRKSLLQLASAAMAHEFLSRIDRDRQTVLVPVPMHPSARRRRGFNQAELLAEGVSALTGVPTVLALGKRVRTPPQSLTARRNRADNVRGVFEPSGGRLDGCRVYLVDDLVTTGATVAACAAAVLSAGAGEVRILCLARTP
jgi:ComF family protein